MLFHLYVCRCLHKKQSKTIANGRMPVPKSVCSPIRIERGIMVCSLLSFSLRDNLLASYTCSATTHTHKNAISTCIFGFFTCRKQTQASEDKVLTGKCPISEGVFLLETNHAMIFCLSRCWRLRENKAVNLKSES